MEERMMTMRASRNGRGWWGAAVGLGGMLLLAGAVVAEDAPAKGQWISMFNGKDLEGWTPKIRGCPLGENFKNTFRVTNGVLCVSFDQYEQFDNRFGHLFYKQAYSNYIMRLEYRFTGDQCPGGPGWAYRNSGVMVHGQPPATMDVGQNFPVSIEVQILGGNGKDERSTGNMCSPGTHIVKDGKLYTPHGLNSKSKTFHGDQWVQLEIEVHGADRIVHRINGEAVLEYTGPQLDPNDGDAKKLVKDGQVLLTGGSISLQSESHPCEFRKIEIQPLEK